MSRTQSIKINAISILLLSLFSFSTSWDFSKAGIDWPSSCSSPNQSPIDISLPFTYYKPKLSFSYAKMQTEYMFYNDGNNLILEGDFGFMHYNDDLFLSSQVLFYSPSLHTVNNHRHPLEMQIIHHNNKGKLLTVCVLFKESDADYSTLLGKLNFDSESLQNMMPFTPVKVKEQIDLSKYIHQGQDFFIYDGVESLPPCEKDNTVLILTDIINVSKKQLSNFPLVIKGNNRVIQHRYDRPIYLTFDLRNIQKKIDKNHEIVGDNLKRIVEENKIKITEQLEILAANKTKVNDTLIANATNITTSDNDNKSPEEIQAELEKQLAAINNLTGENKTENESKEASCCSPSKSKMIPFDLIKERAVTKDEKSKKVSMKMLGNGISSAETNKDKNTLIIDKEVPKSKDYLESIKLKEKFAQWKSLKNQIDTGKNITTTILMQFTQIQKELEDKKYMPYIKEKGVFLQTNQFVSFVEKDFSVTKVNIEQFVYNDNMNKGLLGYFNFNKNNEEQMKEEEIRKDIIMEEYEEDDKTDIDKLKEQFISEDGLKKINITVINDDDESEDEESIDDDISEIKNETNKETYYEEKEKALPKKVGKYNISETMDETNIKDFYDKIESYQKKEEEKKVITTKKVKNNKRKKIVLHKYKPKSKKEIPSKKVSIDKKKIKKEESKTEEKPKEETIKKTILHNIDIFSYMKVIKKVLSSIQKIYDKQDSQNFQNLTYYPSLSESKKIRISEHSLKALLTFIYSIDDYTLSSKAQYEILLNYTAFLLNKQNSYYTLNHIAPIESSSFSNETLNKIAVSVYQNQKKEISSFLYNLLSDSKIVLIDSVSENPFTFHMFDKENIDYIALDYLRTKKLKKLIPVEKDTTLQYTKFECKNNLFQSPININGPYIAEEHLLSFNFSTPSEIVISKDAYKIMITGNFGSFSHSDKHFEVYEIDLHFPSEHTYGDNETRAVMEMQIIGKDNESNIGAIASLFDYGTSNQVLSSFGFDMNNYLYALKLRRNEKITVNEPNILSNINLLYAIGANPKDRRVHFVTYQGTLTSFPCQKAQWFVIEGRLTISRVQAQYFQVLFGKKNNVRELQLLNNRVLKVI